MTFGIALGSNLEAHIKALRELQHRQRCAGKNCTCPGPWVRNICQSCGGTDLGIARFPGAHQATFTPSPEAAEAVAEWPGITYQ